MAAAQTKLSLKRQLLLWLLLPQLFLWLVGGTLSYRIALSYADKAIDQSLTQSLRSLARQVKPVGSGLLIDFPAAAKAIIEEDPNDRVSYMVSSPPGQFILGNATLPEPPALVRAQLAKTGSAQVYSSSHASGSSAGTLQTSAPLRSAALELSFGDSNPPQRMRVQVAKSSATRERIARELVLDMLVPLLLLGALLGALVYGGIVRGLQPLARLQSGLQARTGTSESTANTRFAPIELNQAPQEVLSLSGAVNELLAAVERSVSQEKRFINDAAHQLRTPLAGAKSQLDLALSEKEPLAHSERLHKVNSALERSSHLVHQLLQLARSEVAPQMQRLDAVQLARSVAQDAAPSALAAGADFGFEAPNAATIDSPPLWIYAHALLLREAIQNLIDNAVRYAGQSVEITLRVRQQDSQIVFEVEDRGVGLTAEQRSHMFRRFWRGSDLPGGAGLGLSIVQEITERHGGQVRTEQVFPQGLKVQVVLPAADSIC
jgi:two-component system, OmpR family, sensor histidine kinase TctE